MPAATTRLSAAEIAGYATGAGFSGNALNIAVAVALAESGGRPGVVSVTNDVGLWQINVKAHPQWTAAALKDPSQNAKAAYSISSGGSNWSPWVTYKTGAYLLYLPTAKAGVKENGGQSRSVVGNPDVPKENITAGPLESLASLAEVPAKITAWISDRNNVFRIVKVLVGGGLIIAGLIAVTRPVVEPAAKTVAKAVR